MNHRGGRVDIFNAFAVGIGLNLVKPITLSMIN